MYYLIAIICSIISYDIARAFTKFKTTFAFFENNKLDIPIIHIFWYADILIAFLVLIFGIFLKRAKQVNVFDFRFYLKNRDIVIFLAFPMIAASLKSYLSGELPGSVIMTYGLFTPFLACWLSSKLLKEKIPPKYNIAIILAFIGFVITKSTSISLGTVNFFLICYIIVNAVSTITIRHLSLKRTNIEGIFFENLSYALIGLGFFLLCGGFQLKYLFSLQVLCVAIPSIIHHTFVILGNQKSKYFASIIFTDFFKVSIALLSGLLFFSRLPTVYEIIGMFILCFSVVFLHSSDYILIKIKSLFVWIKKIKLELLMAPFMIHVLM